MKRKTKKSYRPGLGGLCESLARNSGALAPSPGVPDDTTLRARMRSIVNGIKARAREREGSVRDMMNGCAEEIERELVRGLVDDPAPLAIVSWSVDLRRS